MITSEPNDFKDGGSCGRRSTPQRRKRVRFAISQISAPENTTSSMSIQDNNDTNNNYADDEDFFSSDESCCCWWNSADLKYFKWRMISAAKEALRHPIWKNRLLKIYNASGNLSFYSSNSENKLFEKLQNLKIDPVLLSLWCDEDDSAKQSRRGLEKFSRTVIGTDGQPQISTKSSYLYRRMVLLNQGKLTQEQLRQQCLKLSRQDRIFARILGAADAVVACGGHLSDVETVENRWSTRMILASALLDRKQTKNLPKISTKTQSVRFINGSPSLTLFTHRQLSSKQA